MTKKAALILLAIVCILAIYNLKSPSSEAPQAQLSDVNIVEEIIVPVETQRTPDAVPVAISRFSQSTQNKISTLKQILTTKNDNDPRMDTDLKNLSNEDKDALVTMYQDLKPESLNDKGTIAFLIGREMTRPEDAEFLKNILSEEPCLSLDNCGITNGGSDPHMDNVNDVTLNYPQIVALNRIKTFVQTQDLQSANPTILNHLTDAVKIGQNSKNSIVQNHAKEIANLLTKPRK